jgi:acyl-CoA synthetase (AMP-forming)/AMP-acid ligase II/acyl carrier protein
MSFTKGTSQQKCTTLIELLQFRVDLHPDALAYRFLGSGDVDGPLLEWTYAEVYSRVQIIASRLQGAGTEKECVLLLYPPGLEFIAAFMGCLSAGAIAVPAYPHRTLSRLEAIVRDSHARIVLTTSAFLKFAQSLGIQAPELSDALWIATDEIETKPISEVHNSGVKGETIAFLQYTSGSTGQPKGVMVSHANLLHNQLLIERAFGAERSSNIVGWLPLYHDMGLIGNVLQTLYVGASCTLMSPVAFQQRPMRWLECISRFGGTISGGPNFAFDFCAKTMNTDQHLDLRSWKVAFDGSEPVRKETLERFTTTFGPHGFSAEAFYPCYGLAEATLFVTGADGTSPQPYRTILAEALERGYAREPQEDRPAATRTVVSCGRSQAEQQVLIVNPETCVPCSDQVIGEIWVAGPSVAQGYWRQPEESGRVFGAQLKAEGNRTFLRTGDLGFAINGELFVTGRLKDLIIIRGRNLYPQDIEYVVEQSHPTVRLGGCAAFSLQGEEEEKLAVAAEVTTPKDNDTGSLQLVVDAIRRAVAQEHGIQTHTVMLLKPKSIPKTSSGKIRRDTCRKNFIGRNLEIVFLSELATSNDSRLADRIAPFSTEGAALPRTSIEDQVARIWAEILALKQVGYEDDFFALGGDSLRLTQMATRIHEKLGIEVPPRLLFSAGTVRKLAALIEQAAEEKRANGLNIEKVRPISRLERMLVSLPKDKTDIPSNASEE